MWQALHEELHPRGCDVVTVALDAGGADAARPFVQRAQPTHPSLLDATHRCDEVFGFVNVPNAVWIDETGTIVRPAHAAHVRRSQLRDMKVPDGLPPRIADTLEEVKKFRVTDAEQYRAAIDDWVANGSESPWALRPDDVVAASRPRPREHAEAAAAFELAQHLWGAGQRDRAVRWFTRAHELQPENWTYKRQAWSFATTKPGELTDMLQGPNDLFESNWLDDVRRIGAEKYYRPFDEL